MLAIGRRKNIYRHQSATEEENIFGCLEVVWHGMLQEMMSIMERRSIGKLMQQSRTVAFWTLTLETNLIVQVSIFTDCTHFLIQNRWIMFLMDIILETTMIVSITRMKCLFVHLSRKIIVMSKRMRTIPWRSAIEIDWLSVYTSS